MLETGAIDQSTDVYRRGYALFRIRTSENFYLLGNSVNSGAKGDTARELCDTV
jgi:hypothetical protein